MLLIVGPTLFGRWSGTSTAMACSLCVRESEWKQLTKGKDTGSLNFIVLSENPDPIYILDAVITHSYESPMKKAQ